MIVFLRKQNHGHKGHVPNPGTFCEGRAESAKAIYLIHSIGIFFERVGHHTFLLHVTRDPDPNPKNLNPHFWTPAGLSAEHAAGNVQQKGWLRPQVGISLVCVKASPAFGRQRLPRNTDFFVFASKRFRVLGDPGEGAEEGTPSQASPGEVGSS